MHHKLLHMKYFLIFISTLFLWTSCSSDEEGKAPIKGRRTVLVYISGENDLNSPFIDNDIHEMIEGRKQVADDENLIIYVDKASTVQKPFIARITKDENHPVDTLYKFSEDLYSSDPVRLQEVLQWVVTNCPATEDYGLVLWGHANGWIIMENAIPLESSAANRRAYGRDTGNNTESTYQGMWINIPTMRQVFEQLGIQWKFIFCDCCNMQCVEVAYEWRNICDYLIASPAEITGLGAPYHTVVKDFFIHDDELMYKGICDDYFAQVTNNTGGTTGTLDRRLPISTIKMANMQNLADATREVLPTVTNQLGMPCNDFSTSFIYYYQLVSFNGWGYSYKNEEKVCYDMKHVIMTALQDYPEAYDHWLQALNQAVIYKRNSGKWHTNTVKLSDFIYDEEYQGNISMFFPLEKYESTTYKYNSIINQMQWYQAVGWSELGW